MKAGHRYLKCHRRLQPLHLIFIITLRTKGMRLYTSIWTVLNYMVKIIFSRET